MNEYDALNAFLQLLHQNENVFLYRTFENINHVISMKKFISNHNINLPFIKELDINDEFKIQMCSTVNDISSLDDLLSTDCSNQIKKIQHEFSKLYHVVFIHGVDANQINNDFIDVNYVNKYLNNNIMIYHSVQQIKKENLSFNGPYEYFMSALYQIDKWPGLLVFKGDKHVFIPTQTNKQVKEVFTLINENKIFDAKTQCNEDMYMIHLSDLHLGSKRKNKGVEILEDSLDSLVPKLSSAYKPHFLVTGDIINSPNRKNMYQGTSFLNKLKKKYRGKVTYVLGNHDVLAHGLNLGRKQRSKVVAYLLGSHVTTFEQEKVIYIKINSTIQGNLARGKVGQEQLAQLSGELDSIDNIEDYTLIALVHHHVLQIPKDAFLKTKWHEKMFIGRWVENSKVLLDADILLEWLKEHNVNYVLHGHRHLPFFNYDDGLYVISGGSSSGGGATERKSRYLSYNLLKYDCDSQSMKYCFICYDDMTKLERQRVKVHLFEEEFYEVS